MNAKHTYQLIATVTLATLVVVLPARADGWLFHPTDDTQVTQPGSDSNYGHWQHMDVRNKYGGGGSWELDSLVRSRHSTSIITVGETTTPPGGR